MNRKTLLLLIFIAAHSFLFSQKNINLFSEKVENGFNILANNDEIYPVTIKIDFNLQNLNTSSPTHVFVLPAKAQNIILTTLSIATIGEAYRYSFKYSSFMGDALTAKHDKNFVYELPFVKGSSFKLHQGYNGNFSHQNENALDFTMPIGTQVVAARDGMVIQVKDNSNQGCPRKSCMDYNNYITILHSDGTYAKYVHLDFEGAKVKVGDVVKAGDVIALSGNTGYSSGPHLHFVCYLPSVEEKTTLETKFKINDGSTFALLIEGNIYTKNY